MNQILYETGITHGCNLNPASTEGPLSGLTVAVKDLFHIAGMPTYAGNPSWAETHSVPEQTSDVVNQLLSAGANIIGKSLTDELAYSLNGINAHYGTPKNHSAPDRLPGGSSSGSAVAVSSNTANIGLGTDTGGSIRVPSSYNGLFGIRPTHGLISESQMVPLAPSFDTVGWMCRDLDTLQKVAEVLYPQQQDNTKITQLKVLKPVIGGKLIWDSQFDSFVEKISTQFSSVEWIEFDAEFYKQASEAFRILQGSEIWQTHGDWIETCNPKFADDIAERFAWCKTITQDEITAAQLQQQNVTETLMKLCPQDSTILLPTTPGASPKLDATAEFMAQYRIRLMGLTALAGLSGRPQINLPLFSNQDAPWGVSFIGAQSSDKQLIQLVQRLIA